MYSATNVLYCAQNKQRKQAVGALYLNIMLIVIAVAIACKAADMEEMAPPLWGIITCLSCLVCGLYLAWLPPIIRVFTGLVISLAAMFAVKMINKKTRS